MDPITASALISAGSSLLGGILNNKQRNKEIRMSDPAYIRKRAEAAGFNPLLFTNQAFQNSSNVPTFGSAVADAGHFLGEGLLRNEEMKGEQALRITELQQQNERLTELMRRTTLNPASRSIYANSVSSRGDDGSGTSNSGSDAADTFDAATANPAPTALSPNTVPVFTLGGIDFRGSGRVSSGSTFEESLGDTPLQWAIAPLIASDMLGYTGGLYAGQSRLMRRAAQARGRMNRVNLSQSERDAFARMGDVYRAQNGHQPAHWR
jgi:hypothetical protein